VDWPASTALIAALVTVGEVIVRLRNNRVTEHTHEVECPHAGKMATLEANNDHLGRSLDLLRDELRELRADLKAMTKQLLQNTQRD
jgi:hypothetical protein